MEFYSITWNELQELTFQTAKKISADNYSPDLIIAISRGGLTVAQILSDYFDNCPIASFAVLSYKGLKQNNLPQITLPLSKEIILKNKKILLVDDLSDTGETFLAGLKHLQSLGATKIKTACLVTKSKTKYYPDYYVINNDSWIIFPYEAKETTVDLTEMFKKEGLNEKEIIEKLKALKIKIIY